MKMLGMFSQGFECIFVECANGYPFRLTICSQCVFYGNRIDSGQGDRFGRQGCRELGRGERLPGVAIRTRSG
jgi:hypothetical protein